MNKVMLTGRLTKDLELRKTKNDKGVCEFTLATNRINGKDADFINCVVWGVQAENLVKYQAKGNLIGVEGELRAESFEVNGEKRYKTYVLVNQIEYLQGKKEEKKEENPYAAFGNSIKTEFDVGHQIEITDDDMPF